MTQQPIEPDAEQLAEAILMAVEADVASTESRDIPDALVNAVAAVKQLGIEFVRRYNRLEIEGGTRPDEPVLFVANHGFGGIFDLNVYAILAAFEQLALDRPVTMLTHQMAWTLGFGPLLEPLGSRPASDTAAREAFAAGEHVLVLPGGDLDASKTWQDRNRIVFAGRRGFARTAMEAGVPIVPIVTAGAGESLLVLSSGERLARALRLDKLLRIKALPVTVSLPFGLSVGTAGVLPYLPLPTKLTTAVLPAMRAQPDETPEEFGDRVESVMQSKLTEMTAGRRPIVG
jgi:1-acyl-sn-glycerol-3-phosphate acyltransferase